MYKYSPYTKFKLITYKIRIKYKNDPVHESVYSYTLCLLRLEKIVKHCCNATWCSTIRQQTAVYILAHTQSTEFFWIYIYLFILLGRLDIYIPALLGWGYLLKPENYSQWKSAILAWLLFILVCMYVYMSIPCQLIGYNWAIFCPLNMKINMTTS